MRTCIESGAAKMAFWKKWQSKHYQGLSWEEIKEILNFLPKIEMCEDVISRQEAHKAVFHMILECKNEQREPTLKDIDDVFDIIADAVFATQSQNQVKDNEGEYIYPHRCEKCGSENLYIRAIFNKEIVRYVCIDCGESRSLPKQSNIKKRVNTSLSNWSVQVKKHHPFCVICGSKENLEAHHIIPVSHDKSYAYEITNGLTLCRKCHNLVHKKKKEE